MDRYDVPPRTNRRIARSSPNTKPDPSKIASSEQTLPQGGQRRPLALRRRAAAEEPKARLAREFGISRETVYQYLRSQPANGAPTVDVAAHENGK